jgi:polar amino acid transport system ATP-binding protein
MIKINNIWKSIHSLEILKGISIRLEEKKNILGIAGPSGSGKSTLLRCIQGLEKVDKGLIEYSGRVCFMFQDFQLFPHMTVFKNITYAPHLKWKQKDEREEIKQRAYEMLKNLGIDEKALNYPENLSGGQKQRVALARSLMMSPDILLCDEPTSGLDISLTGEVGKLLKSVKNLGVTIIVASHDLAFLTKISDRIILLKNGIVEADIIPQQHDNPGEYLEKMY